MGKLLIAGGSRDTNLAWLRDIALRLGVDCEALLIDPANLPEFQWEPGNGPPRIGSRAVEASAAFIRYDVFESMASPTPGAAHAAQAWFAALIGWCEVENLFTFNRQIDPVSGSKVTMLTLAREAGLGVPATIVTNSAAVPRKLDRQDFIAKPVAGGSYVMALGEAIDGALWVGETSPSPAILQPRLVYPERRIYRVGDDFFAFDIRSSTLDSRRDTAGSIVPFELDDLPPGVIEALRRLTDRLRCDFCAVDMKTDPANGELLFLELNNGPMFMGYDRTRSGTMGEAMVRYLMAGGA